MLEKNKFVVKAQTKLLSTKRTYDIADVDSGETVATAAPTSGFVAVMLGMVMGKDNQAVTIDVRQKADGKVAFSVRRKGFLFKKVEALDGEGKVIGRYKAKRFSLSGGFHVYDKDGKHFADIKGQMFKSNYKFMSPDGSKEIGTVSKTMGGIGGFAKSLLTGAGTYGVEISPDYAGDSTTKMLVLGAAIAVDALFTKHGGKSGGGVADLAGGDE
jgi:uncharacterized protein YxjI